MRPNVNAVKIKEPRLAKPRGRYHHGGLREALIDAGEDILAERGAEGFSLREAARRAGVSPAAPAHHFGDVRGLLTAIATRGFEELANALSKAEQEVGPESRLAAMAATYVEFALQRGALFTLMWRRQTLDIANPDYLAAGRAAFNVFERAATGRDVRVPDAPHTPAPAVLAAWSLIHGYARLALDGAIDPSTPGLTQSVLALLPKPAG
jgi:AcrR family transcriptional regulator